MDAPDSVLHINDDIVDGSFRDLKVSPNSVVVGDALAEKLDVEIGDTIDASFPEANPAALKVVGIYDSGIGKMVSVDKHSDVIEEVNRIDPFDLC